MMGRGSIWGNKDKLKTIDLKRIYLLISSNLIDERHGDLV